MKLFKKMMDKWNRYWRQKKEYKQQKQYYTYLQQGALFLNFIMQDLKRTKNQNMNRHQRRRFEKELYKKGQFSPEMIKHYSARVNHVMEWFEQNEKKTKKKTSQSVKKDS